AEAGAATRPTARPCACLRAGCSGACDRQGGLGFLPVAAGGTMRVAAQLELTERRRLRVEHQQPPDERLAVAHEDLEGLVRLKNSDDAWEHAQDPGLASSGGKLVRRRLGVHAAVARAALGRPERAGVAFEPEDRTVDVGLALLHGRLIDEV